MTSENPIENAQPKEKTGQKSDIQSSNSTPQVSAGPAQSQANPSPHHCEITCNKKRDFIDWGTLALEGFGLLVLVIYTIATVKYACITYNMWNEMQTQTGIQKTAASNAERAWVVVYRTAFKYFSDKNGIGRVQSQVVLQNTGLSPAFHFQGWRCAQVEENEPSVDVFPEGNLNCRKVDAGLVGKDVPVWLNAFDQTANVQLNSLQISTDSSGPHL